MSSTAMIYAMHQIMSPACCGIEENSVWHERCCDAFAPSSLLSLLRRRKARAAERTFQRSADRTQRLAHKPGAAATVISYGANADAIVTTARRTADARASDQVLAVFLKEDYSLEPLVAWDTLGMRGTAAPALLSKPR